MENNIPQNAVQAPLASQTSMDLTAPIDIQGVIGAVKLHQDLLTAIDMLDAGEVLSHCYGIPGVKDSITLGRVEGGSVSSMYNGVFIGRNAAGKIVPRTLIVYPVKIEEADEPERYRRTYISEVRGGLYDGGHPFEVWLIAHVLGLASQDLLNVLFTAEYDSTQISGSANADIKYAFNGFGTIAWNEKTAATPTISVAIGNEFQTGVMTTANIGDQLLAMWRSRPETFRRKNSKLYLRGTQGKVEIVKAYGLAQDSQFVLLTTQQNMCYGFDKEEDMKSVIPFNSGNPYWFTMAGKYVFGCQFASIHKSEFCINDRRLAPDYIAVTSPSGNPKTQGWYVKSGNDYVLTTDTSVQSGTTYYAYTI